MKRFMICCISFLFAILIIASSNSYGKTASGEMNMGTNSGSQSVGEYTVEEIGFERDGKHIYGKLYMPKAEEPLPIAIIAHGFGGNLTQVEGYAEAFAANGIAACAFDFIGGGFGSRSDGTMTEMSVLTEAADLDVVIDGLTTRDDIDASNLFLLGGSQGGFVSTYVAGTRPNAVKGLIALYPAYVLQDDAWRRTPDPDSIPETMDIMGMTVGRIYNRDAMSFDIYDVMRNYPGDVLIIHGTNDSIAPISYSERAVTVFPSAELIRFEGAGHGFFGSDEARSAQMAVGFVKEHLSKTSVENTKTQQMKMSVSDGSNEVVFLLNDSSASKSLYEQLPFTIEVENYSTNEKIFYPPEPLDTSNVIEGDGPFGTLAYFSPWGNVVMYYSECGEYPGLYILGAAIKGADNIEKLNGTVHILSLDS